MAFNRYIRPFAIAVTFALAACGGDIDTADADANSDGEVSMAEAADAAEAAGLKPEAGLYKITTQMKGMDMSGVPAEMSGEGLGFTNTSEHCLTQEEVDKGFEEMMKKGQEGECSYDRFELSSDGAITGKMVCSTSRGSMAMDFTGTVTSTSSDMDTTMTANIPGLGEGTMSMNVKQERIGECAG